MNVWLAKARKAVPVSDIVFFDALVSDVLELVAADPNAPKGWEALAACELALTAYYALDGDLTIPQALKTVAGQDGVTKGRAHTAVAESRAAAKLASGRAVADVVVRVRALRNLGVQTDARRGKGDVLPFQRRSG